MRTKQFLSTITVVGAIALAGCSDDSGSSDAEFNDVDVAFAQQMIPHHEQALMMASVATERAESDEVRDLAASIEEAQRPEIDTMTEWLGDWDQDVPEDGDMGGMDEGMMMSSDDMDHLETMPAAEFDQMWLSMMIEHHEGAIEMADVEQSDGENPDAIELAETIEQSQSDEIDQMEELLN